MIILLKSIFALIIELRAARLTNLVNKKNSLGDFTLERIVGASEQEDKRVISIDGNKMRSPQMYRCRLQSTHI